ncbi:MAG TPA: hypothetical protein PLD35_05575, partial [Caldisericia bacterium]|nr:hypothetical protein [Caldisericia bacterium]
TVLSGGLEDLTRCSILPDSGIIEQPNKDYNIKWEMDEYGNVKLSAVDKAGNPVKLSPEDQDVLNSLEKGMNDALNWLEEEGFIKTFSVFLPGIFHLKVLGFISKYSSMFYRIVGGVTPENAYELGYNATIGVAISYQMVQYSEKSFNDFDSEIGFWTSYWSRKSGLVYNKNSNRSGMHFYGDAKHLGLLDVANLSKAIIYRESTFDPDAHRGDSNGFKGLMGVAYEGSDADYDFIGQFGGPTGFAKTGADFYKPFNNIGMGVGMLFGKLASSSTYLYSEGHREAPTAQQWWEAVTYYYGKTNPDGSIDIIACEEYANGVWSLFRTGYDQLGNQIWSIESQNWVKYYGNYKNWWDSKGWVMPIW